MQLCLPSFSGDGFATMPADVRRDVKTARIARCSTAELRQTLWHCLLSDFHSEPLAEHIRSEVPRLLLAKAYVSTGLTREGPQRFLFNSIAGTFNKPRGWIQHLCLEPYARSWLKRGQTLELGRALNGPAPKDRGLSVPSCATCHRTT